MVQLLAAAGADVNALNSAQSTPLHEAILGGNTECLRALLDARADPDGRGFSQAMRAAAAAAAGPANRQCGFFAVRPERENPSSSPLALPGKGLETPPATPSLAARAGARSSRADWPPPSHPSPGLRCWGGPRRP